MTAIPAMTHPLGRHWQQPPRERVLVDDEHALVSRADFKLLAEYSASRPTGAYEGKMWRSLFRGEWFLMWYEPSEKPDHVRTNFRRLLVAE